MTDATLWLAKSTVERRPGEPIHKDISDTYVAEVFRSRSTVRYMFLLRLQWDDDIALAFEDVVLVQDARWGTIRWAPGYRWRVTCRYPMYCTYPWKDVRIQHGIMFH